MGVSVSIETAIIHITWCRVQREEFRNNQAECIQVERSWDNIYTTSIQPKYDVSPLLIRTHTHKHIRNIHMDASELKRHLANIKCRSPDTLIAQRHPFGVADALSTARGLRQHHQNRTHARCILGLQRRTQRKHQRTTHTTNTFKYKGLAGVWAGCCRSVTLSID